MTVRTRFAPSPTGFMHVGGVRTALFAWLVAKQAGGQFVLRIEDTDKAREVKGSQAHIEQSLRWLSLDWDEGPFRQSERLDVYKKWAEKLIEAGRAYADTRTEDELNQLREDAKSKKKPFLARDYRPENPPRWEPGMPLRFKSEPKNYNWHDEVMGDLSTGPEVVDDFILIKSDGYPTYNFAHIVDDAEMSVSHVIRSQEFLASMPKFLNLYEALGLSWPKFATLPFVLGPDGKKKLSKRDGAKDILDYKNEGYLPEALVSFLATLGWNDGTTQEIFSREELIKKFKLDRVQRSGARFDEKRLDWINGSLIRELSLEQLSAKIADYWPESAKSADQKLKLSVLELVKDRLKTLAELQSLAGFFFEEPSDQAIKELFDKSGIEQSELRELLSEARQDLGQSDFSYDDIKDRLNGLLEKLNTKPKSLFSVVRIAISGAPASPELFGSLQALGKEKTLSRLDKALALLD